MKRINKFLGNIMEKVFYEYFPTTLTVALLIFLYAIVRWAWC